MKKGPEQKSEAKEEEGALHFCLILEDEFIELMRIRLLYERRGKRDKKVSGAELKMIQAKARFYRYASSSALLPTNSQQQTSRLPAILQGDQPLQPSEVPRPAPVEEARSPDKKTM